MSEISSWLLKPITNEDQNNDISHGQPCHNLGVCKFVVVEEEQVDMGCP